MTLRQFSTSTYSAFMSYAVDDDRSWNRWVSVFKAELALALPGRLRGIKVPEPYFSGDKPVVAGRLSDQLHERISESFAMFLFVHDNYNESPWCLKELTYFKSLSGDDGFRDRLYVIAMSERAIGELTARPAWRQLCPFDDQVWFRFYRDDDGEQPIEIYPPEVPHRGVVATDFWRQFVLVREDFARKIRTSIASEPRPPTFPTVRATPAPDPLLVRVYIESNAEEEKYSELIGHHIVAGWDRVVAALHVHPVLYLRPTGIPMTEIDRRPLLDDADGVVLLWSKKTPEAVAAQIRKVEPKLTGPIPAPGLIAYVMEGLDDRPAGRSIGNWNVVRCKTDPAGIVAVAEEDEPLLEAFLRSVLERKQKRV